MQRLKEPAPILSVICGIQGAENAIGVRLFLPVVCCLKVRHLDPPWGQQDAQILIHTG